LPRDLAPGQEWTPLAECLRQTPASMEQADLQNPSVNDIAMDQLVTDQDRIRQPRRHLFTRVPAKQGVSIHRGVEDYLETNLLAEEINHDFGVWETPTYRATMRAYTQRRKEHLSNLYVYSEREKQERIASVSARLSGKLVTSQAGPSLQELWADQSGIDRYQERKEQRDALASLQYAKRQSMQRQLTAVNAHRTDCGKQQILQRKGGGMSAAST